MRTAANEDRGALKRSSCTAVYIRETIIFARTEPDGHFPFQKEPCSTEIETAQIYASHTHCSGLFGFSESRKCPESGHFAGNQRTVLRQADCLAEREGFEPPIPFRV